MAEKKTLSGPRKNVSPLHAHFSFGTKKKDVLVKEPLTQFHGVPLEVEEYFQL